MPCRLRAAISSSKVGMCSARQSYANRLNPSRWSIAVLRFRAPLDLVERYDAPGHEILAGKEPPSDGGPVPAGVRNSRTIDRPERGRRQQCRQDKSWETPPWIQMTLHGI